MFRFRKILFSACLTLLLTFVLAVPSFALVSVDNVGYGYISLNGLSPVYSTGSFPRGVYDSTVKLSSYTVYLSFDEVAEKFSVSLSFLSRAVTSYGTYSCSYDTFAMVKCLEKSCKDGDMLSDEEILNLRVGDSLADARANFKRQAKKSKKARKSR